MLFHMFVVVCDTLTGSCTLLKHPDTYAQPHACDSALTETIKELGETHAEEVAGGGFYAECLGFPDGYDIVSNYEGITKRIMRVPDPAKPEERS